MNRARSPLLELQGITRTFMIKRGFFQGKQPLHALNDVSLQINPGEVLGLVGESGCGKSTLAKILLGLLPPSTGEVLMNGKPIASHDRRSIARQIQPIFQDPYSSLNPRKTIAQIVSLPLRVHGIGDSTQRRQAVEDILDLVGLPRRLYQAYPNQLSGGQRQRVAIARALIIKPSVVICDEPTSALDVSVQSQIINLLIDLRQELGLTYLLISHNLAVVEHLATRVAVMYLGRIVEEAETDQLFATPRHPYTQALLASVLTPVPGLAMPDTQLGITFPNPIDPPTGCSFHPRCSRVKPICQTQQPKTWRDSEGLIECHWFGNNADLDDQH